MTAWTPAYFRALADDYHRRAETALAYELPEVVVRQLRDAGLQFRYAAQAIEQAAKKRKQRK